MKNLLLVFIFTMVGLVSTAAQSTAIPVGDQLNTEVVATANAVVLDYEFSPVACRLSAATGIEVTPVDSVEEFSGYQVVNYKGARLNCAGFGVSLQTDTENNLSNIEDDPAESESESTLSLLYSFYTNNQIIILAFLLALSELLALIPGINQNGIFQSILSFLKSKDNTKTATK